jgi:fatty acid desaturase
MKSHHKSMMIVIGTLIVVLGLPLLIALYWHFFILAVLISSFLLSFGLVVVFTYYEIKEEIDFEENMDENMTYNFTPMQKRFYHNSLKSLRGEK